MFISGRTRLHHPWQPPMTVLTASSNAPPPFLPFRSVAAKTLCLYTTSNQCLLTAIPFLPQLSSQPTSLHPPSPLYTTMSLPPCSLCRLPKGHHATPAASPLSPSGTSQPNWSQHRLLHYSPFSCSTFTFRIPSFLIFYSCSAFPHAIKTFFHVPGLVCPLIPNFTKPSCFASIYKTIFRIW